MADDLAVLVGGHDVEAVDPRDVAAQGVDEVGLQRGVEGREVDLADGGDVGAGLGSGDPVGTRGQDACTSGVE
ncbi:hypothetical protein ACI2L1_44785 [Streptomyces sp. NPDC019531]|uniref:hypothetical protein n=1 Tax=Streptomyces sp. NPDC019531 TaxID=3365062 RepID=UPI00384ABFA7